MNRTVSRLKNDLLVFEGSIGGFGLRISETTVWELKGHVKRWALDFSWDISLRDGLWRVKSSHAFFQFIDLVRFVFNRMPVARRFGSEGCQFPDACGLSSGYASGKNKFLDAPVNPAVPSLCVNRRDINFNDFCYFESKPVKRLMKRKRKNPVVMKRALSGNFLSFDF